MAGTSSSPGDRADLLFDLGSSGLLAGFIVALLAGSVWPIPQYNYVATILLVGTFATVYFSNRRRDLLRDRSVREDPR